MVNMGLALQHPWRSLRCTFHPTKNGLWIGVPTSIMQRTSAHRNLLQRAAAPSSITPRNNCKPSVLLALGCYPCWNSHTYKNSCVYSDLSWGEGLDRVRRDLIEFELVERQLAVNEDDSNSWASCEETPDPVWSSEAAAIALLHDLQGTVAWLCDNQGAQSIIWLS